MKKILFILTTLITASSYSQNVGIGNTNPTNQLHVTPIGLNDPLRIDGLNQYTIERHLFITDPNTGVVKHMHVDSLASVVSNLTGDDNQNIDSLTLNGVVLTAYIEDGGSSSINLQSLIDSAIANSTNTDNQNIDSLVLNGTLLTTYIQNGTSSSVNLQAIIDSAVANSTGTDDQNLLTPTLSGTTLTTNIEGGSSTSINLQPIVDSAIANSTGTDDQNLLTPTLTGTTLNTNIEGGASTSINLQPIVDSAIANSTGDSDWDINANGTGLEGTPGINIASGLNSIAAGDGNTASSTNTVAFGANNTASRVYAVVSGGLNNTASGIESVVAGGELNTSSGTGSAIVGGNFNVSSNFYSFVGGGRNDTASEDYSVVVGGFENTVSGVWSSILGGRNNKSSSIYSGIYSGRNNNTLADYSVVSGGRNNTAFSFGEWVGGIYSRPYTPSSATSWIATDRLFVVGNGTNSAAPSNALVLYKDGRLEINEAYTLPNTDGTNNQVLTTNGSGTVSWAAASGGDSDWDINANSTGLEGNPGANVASGSYSLSAGNGNTASGNHAVAFGLNNTAVGNESFIGAGALNTTNGTRSVIVAGQNNTVGVTGTEAIIVGGAFNNASGVRAVIAGGFSNTASAQYSSILGGGSNVSSGNYSSVSGGRDNTAQSYGEWVGGVYATVGSGNVSSFVATDRLFVVGNGTSTSARSNALVLYKDGRLEINEAYTLPNTDGSANQVLTTNGSGTVTWSGPVDQPDANITWFANYSAATGIASIKNGRMRIKIARLTWTNPIPNGSGTLGTLPYSCPNGIIQQTIHPNLELFINGTFLQYRAYGNIPVPTAPPSVYIEVTQ